MFDTHIHTSFSTDSEMDIKEVITKVQEDNLGIIITDHMDLNFPVKGKFIFDTKEYFHEYSKYRNEKLLLGIELGMTKNFAKENAKIADENPFDFVLGSLHFVDDIDIYDKIYYEGKDKKTAYDRYFSSMLECIKMHDFVDSMGHIDYIARYSPYDDKEIYYEDYSEYIDEILKQLVKMGIAMELNTRRLGCDNASKALIEIYSRYKELGGKYVTIGSDAHIKGNIGASYKEAIEICDYCQLKVVHFMERKMIL